MKRKLTIGLFCILLLPLLAGCCLSHDWQPATCQAPETCAKCGKTQGETLPHNWQEATCEVSRTCTGCGITEGDPLGHDWQEATCEAPESCTRCAKTQGEALGHAIQPRTIQEGNLVAGICANCNEEVQQPIVWEEFVESILPDEWECTAYQVNGNAYSPDEGDHITFYEDHTFSMQFLEKEITGNWYYNERREDADPPHMSYGCAISSDSTGRVTYLEAMVLDKALNSVIMGMFYQNTLFMCVYNRK